MYCINLKKKNNKPYCKVLKKEVSLFQCNGCAKKEFKNKNAQYSKKIVQKSKKLFKLEKNRFSVFTSDLSKCYICKKQKDDLHEIFGGKNRQNSIKLGLVLPLCRECHRLAHFNTDFSDFLHKLGQSYYEDNLGSKNDFILIFKRNYLD